jgi:aldehyde:ferredoxin oxidoreductase
MFGYAGTILRVDLTKEKIKKRSLPKEWCAKFIGGSGINDYILWKEVTPKIKPLDPENRLIFGVGPLGGTNVPLGTKIRVTSLSPLTGLFGDSSSGGFWGSELKYAGYDHLVVQGRSTKPVYLLINDDQVEIRDAKHLWGLDVHETNNMLEKDLGKEYKVASIGPGGEHLARTANIIFDRHRAAAKTGMGCVMGSKNLKTIAVRGTKGLKIAKPEEVAKISEEIERYISPSVSKGAHERVASLSTIGTLFLIPFYNEIGCHAVRNYQDVVYDKADLLDPINFADNYKIRNISCSTGCPIHCTVYWKIKKGKYRGEMGPKPEYIHTASLGILLDIADWSAICHFQNLVSKYGLDSTETGTSIGLLMELQQRGILTPEDTDGISMDWGNVDSVEEIIRKIAYREGIGNVLADGTLHAAKRIGRGAERYICHSKGLCEVEDVRPNPRWALAYAVSSRGADHLKALAMVDKHGRTDLSEKLYGGPEGGDPTSPKLKGVAVKYDEDFVAVVNSLGICLFNAMELFHQEKYMFMHDYAPLFAAVTGIKISPEEFASCGERIVCLEKSFNARLGISRKDDTLHGRWMWEPCPSGPGKGMKVEDYLEDCLNEYYNARGFNVKTGLPTRKKLEEIGLKEVTEQLQLD